MLFHLLSPRVLWLLLGVVGCFSAQAQRFEPGYLVLLRGDTLRGEVENAFWTDPPKTLRFRPSSTAPISTYQVRQLRAVQLSSGRLLRRELLPIDYSVEVIVDRLPRGYTVRQQPDSVLADALVEGPASLLRMTWRDIPHYFVRRPGQAYLEMSERRYIDQRHRVVDANNYRAQLELYFGDCAAVTALLPRTRFTDDDLTAVVQAFNANCSAERRPGRRFAAADAGQSRFKIQVGPTLGLRYNSMRVRTNQAPGLEPTTLDGLQADGRVHLQPGLYFDVVDGGRHVALHAAVFGSRFGRTTPVASPNGSAYYQGELKWRGRMGVLQLGLRGFRPLGSTAQLVVGSGVELPAYFIDDITLRYGPGEGTRHVIAMNTVTTTGTSDQFDVGFGSTFVPYLEAGLRYGRWTAMLYGRIYHAEDYYDDMVVSEVTPYNGPNGTVLYNQQGYQYTARTISVALTLGYQLNANQDARTP